MGKAVERQHNITVDAENVLYYVDYDIMNVYVNKNNASDIKVGNDPDATQHPEIYEFDEALTQTRFDNFKKKFIEQMTKRYKSLQPVDKMVKGVHYIMESDMFIVAFEDNNWSVGVELLLNKKCKNPNLRIKLQPSFAKGMRDILIKLTGEVHIRTGSWSTTVIDAKKAKEIDDAEKAAAKAAKQTQTTAAPTTPAPETPPDKTEQTTTGPEKPEPDIIIKDGENNA